MNILTFTLLQASAPAGAGQPQGAGGGAFWIMIIAMFVIMWLFMIRPQRKQQKELEKFRNSLKRGDKVVTAGGIVGVVITVIAVIALIVLRIRKKKAKQKAEKHHCRADHARADPCKTKYRRDRARAF